MQVSGKSRGNAVGDLGSASNEARDEPAGRLTPRAWCGRHRASKDVSVWPRADQQSGVQPVRNNTGNGMLKKIRLETGADKLGKYKKSDLAKSAELEEDREWVVKRFD